MQYDISIIGGGLAGCEAAWIAARSGLSVRLYEMRPKVKTGAHRTSDLAELVCSNSFGSHHLDSASGLLMQELEQCDSLLIKCAKETAIPAGSALAVDREGFSEKVMSYLKSYRSITIVREEIQKIPEGNVIIASGPLTSPSLTSEIINFTENENLFFYDAVAPIVKADSIDMAKAFSGSRYGKGVKEAGDYLNCPMNEKQYLDFISTLKTAAQFPLKPFENEIPKGVRVGKGPFFEGCLPIEVLAKRGEKALAFGPLRPVGLINPHTGKRPYAVVQLRRENLAGDSYNLVGFQTNLKYQEQLRVFRMIPGLENAFFLRLGHMHRNIYIFSPDILRPAMQCKKRKNLFFAGQITGVEGYLSSIATGFIAGLNASRYIHREKSVTFPTTTMIGALCHYVTHAPQDTFQPMKANFGILANLKKPLKNKKERNQKFSDRSSQEIKDMVYAIK